MASKPHPHFARNLLAWFDRHGRKDLPWQKAINPYRVWLSEIMLQQTQVATVIPYFERFTQAFPTVQALAAAPLDQVLHLWTGLGYYARARNLHKAAKTVVDQYGGEFPRRVEQLAELPGIGRSTAGAIAAIACGQRAAILDGNVKRVLARYHGIDGWPGETAVAKALWHWAETHTPEQRCNHYTQAIMDLGASLCSRTKPACDQCPLGAGCVARATGRQAQLPGKKPRKALPEKAVQLLLLRNAEGQILLEQRPPQGIWGGLWSLPELEPAQCPEDWASCRHGPVSGSESWPGWRHTFSHYHLDIAPVLVQLRGHSRGVQEPGSCWIDPHQPIQLGLAAPVKKLLEQLAAQALLC